MSDVEGDFGCACRKCSCLASCEHACCAMTDQGQAEVRELDLDAIERAARGEPWAKFISWAEGYLVLERRTHAAEAERDSLRSVLQEAEKALRLLREPRCYHGEGTTTCGRLHVGITRADFDYAKDVLSRISSEVGAKGSEG